jgi:hypothetical protein
MAAVKKQANSQILEFAKAELGTRLSNIGKI